MGSTSESIFKLPAISLMRECLKPGSNSWIDASKFVKQAFEEYGFVLAIHDYFSQEVSEEVFTALKDLFDLPTDIKAKNTSETPFFGYMGPNPEMPLYESSSIEAATMAEAVRCFTNLMWPSGNKHFCEILHSYAMKVSELDQLVTRMVFEAYGAEKYHKSHMQSLTYFIRFTKYRVPQETEVSLGAAAHTDKNFTTMLTQNQVDGLEVQLKNGNWITVKFPPSSVVIMACDAFKVWSNGRIHPPLHQVTMKGTTEPRYSVAQFAYVDRIMQTPEEFVDDQHPLLYKPFDNLGLLRFFNPKKGLSADDLLKAYCGV